MLVSLTKIVHNPPYRDWQCCATVGSTSALDMAYRMFTTRNEFILSEEYTFATAVETAAPLGVRVIGVAMDAQGMLATSLNDILSNWDEAARGAKKPWLLYTVPTGGNPTGATQSEQRRHEIYRVAQKHDLYILEDEPYYFLQMQPYTGPNAPDVPPPASHADFLKSIVPSLLSMDVDGRVMRMDSFSKVIAPGARVGWITASEQIVERFVRHQEVSTQSVSGFSQMALYKLLDETWGHAGYLDWLINLRLEYTKRRDVICHACEEFLPSQVASWNPPAAGMFVGLAYLLPLLALSFLSTEKIDFSISTGLKSTGASILKRPRCLCSISKTRSSTSPSTAECYAPRGAGSAPRQTAGQTCSSERPSPPPPRRISERRFAG